MPYELTTIADTAMPSAIPTMREEKEISMYGDSDRIAKALAKVTGQTKEQPINLQPSMVDSVPAEPGKSAASLPLSPQVAALARKEQKLRQELASLKTSQDALEAERKEIADLKALKAKLAAGDYSEVDKLVDYEKLVQHKLGKDPKSDELEALRSDIAKLKADQEKDINDRLKAAVEQRRVAVKDLIAENPEFSTIKELKAEEAVVQHIVDTWEAEEIELSPEEAAKDVEQMLLEKASKWTALSKLKKEELVREPAAEKKELPPLKTGMKTLTQNMAATGDVKRPQKPLHLMSDSERYAEARRRYEEKYQQMRG